MIKYHPDARFLTDYTAGSLPWSQSLCVATHLHYCAACRLRVHELTELGSALFSRLPPVAVGDDEFERLLVRVGDREARAPSRPAPGAGALPGPVARLCKGALDKLPWRKVGRYFSFAPLALGDPGHETSLFHIRAGGSVPQHRHKGDEITVVLKGSFSDQEDRYEVGDFIVRTRGETHKPVASQNEDCLCLSTLDAPIVMSNWLLRLLAPLLTGRPA